MDEKTDIARKPYRFGEQVAPKVFMEHPEFLEVHDARIKAMKTKLDNEGEPYEDVKQVQYKEWMEEQNTDFVF